MCVSVCVCVCACVCALLGPFSLPGSVVGIHLHRYARDVCSCVHWHQYGWLRLGKVVCVCVCVCVLFLCVCVYVCVCMCLSAGHTGPPGSA